MSPESPHPIMFIFLNLIPSLVPTLPHPHALLHARENLGTRLNYEIFISFFNIIISHYLLFMLTDLDLECEVANGGLNGVPSISIATCLMTLSTGTLLAIFITV